MSFMVSMTQDQNIPPSLIKAAPQLLESLKELLDLAPYATGPEFAAAHRRAERAIDNAEGRSK